MKNSTNYIELPEKINLIYEYKNKRTVRIWTMKHNGQNCYGIERDDSPHMELIDYDEKILALIIKKIKRSGALVLICRNNSVMFTFQPTLREKSVSLRLYVYAKYNNLETRKVRRSKIFLYDRSLIDYGILDLRSNNLYDAGGFRPLKNGQEIRQISGNSGQEKFLMVKSEKDNAVEFFDYSPELHEMLATSSMCRLSYGKSTGRLAVLVQYGQGKENTVTVNLSRFAAIYYKEFQRYKNLNGAIKRFIHDFPTLTAGISEQVDHVNAYKFINCKANLLFMDRKLNRDKSNLMLNFGSANIKVNTAINDRQEVLVEYIMPQGKTIYYKCKTPEDFVNWQQLFLGKSGLTNHTKIVDYIKRQWIFLRDVFRNTSKSDLTVGEKTEIFQKWIHNSKRLLYMDAINDKSFPIYTANWKFKNMIVPDKVGQVLEYGITGWEFIGQPIEEVHIRIEKLEQRDVNKE